ncbi:MAG: 2-succinyl-5-enolpyruvyl-6-hydroxy-3-cyclohexene-1-carboxylic-acid synthase, partial [Actinomycetota bacterium]|nr:2-succinyl-5-enolpyruvyl-6-hydroxy-3-cyclohexene-1-carboxylic-acid synthase [Actinomycetota bacterium]
MDRTNANTALASAFTEELARCGVRQAVISPGSRSTPLALALWRQPEIEVTVALDERSGSFFALGAAQATGIPVALLCTSGTAAANFHPAVAEADLSAVPLVVLTADRPAELRDIGAGQTIDQIKLFGSAVRWFSEVGNHDADDTGLIHYRATACRAFAIAAGDPRPGPVHLNLAWREPLAPVAVPGAVTAISELALEGRTDRPLTEVGVPTASAGLPILDTVVSSIGASDRVLLVAGRQPDPALRDPLTRLAGLCEAVILAEPTSQLRLGPHDRGAVITAYDRIVTRNDPALVPDLIIRIGETPTSKRLRTWITELDDVQQIVIDPSGGWYDPSRTADLILRA